MPCHAVGHGGLALDSIKWHLIVIKSNRTDLVAELDILIGITNGLPWYIQTLVQMKIANLVAGTGLDTGLWHFGTSSKWCFGPRPHLKRTEMQSLHPRF